MHGTIQRRAETARNIDRKNLRGSAGDCGDRLFGDVCRLIWPENTACHLASEVGCSLRTAEYEISGKKEVSLQSAWLVFSKMVPGWKKPGR